MSGPGWLDRGPESLARETRTSPSRRLERAIPAGPPQPMVPLALFSSEQNVSSSSWSDQTTKSVTPAAGENNWNDHLPASVVPAVSDDSTCLMSRSVADTCSPCWPATVGGSVEQLAGGLCRVRPLVRRLVSAGDGAVVERDLLARALGVNIHVGVGDRDVELIGEASR